MGISVSYLNIESREVGRITSPSPDRSVIDQTLRNSDLYVDFIRW
jgi:hypothetical protein